MQATKLTEPSRKLALKSWVGALDAVKLMEAQPHATFPSVLEGISETFADKICLFDAETHLTYGELMLRARQVSRWALAEGFVPGTTICLLMPNCPDYVAIWLGLTQIGCVVALLNTNVVGDALAGCIEAAAAEHVIVAAALQPVLSPIAARLPGLRLWIAGGPATPATPEATGFDPTAFPGTSLTDSEVRPPVPGDTALLIYTSGTTGLPKAAKVTHGRILEWSLWFAGMMDVTPDDRLYDCLPLYHSTGGIVAIGAMLIRGASVCIRARFSARSFWEDITANDCTIFQYIGELCRYLLAAPHDPRAGAHRLRLACGNGLQASVWQAFQQRFAIPRILEFYAATEGNVSLYNAEGRPGAIGRIPAFLAHNFPIALIACDPQTGEPVRDTAGLCIACGPDEIGEALGRLSDDSAAPARQFNGYTDSAASARKILRGVFDPHDRWFRTGDLMRRDAVGYYYFIDRIGDTFRWKGENVSTTEVAGVLGRYPGVTGVAVYGVLVPGHEGRAGMAAMTIDGGFDLSGLHDHLAAGLPAYARPVFIRICQTLDITGTFKLQKQQLISESYAPPAADPVWLYDRRQGAFIACDAQLRQSIAAGKLSNL